MLRDSAVDVRKHYYDPKFHGVDWDAVIEKAEDNISKADTLNAAVSEVAAALDALNDSHTFFSLRRAHTFTIMGSGCR